MIRPRSRKAFAAALLVTALAISAGAQAAPGTAGQAAGTAAARRKAQVAVAALGSRDELVESILESELGAMLDREGVEVLGRIELRAEGRAPEPPSEQRITMLLGGLDAKGADIIVAAFYLSRESELTFQFVLFDPEVDVVVGGTVSRARKGLAAFANIQSSVAELEPSIERYVEGAYRVEARTGFVERIVVEGARDGSRVVILDRDYGTVSGGRLVVPYTQFAIGATVPIAVSKDGYHSRSLSVTLDEQQETVVVPPLRRETRIDLGARWSLGQAAGLGFGSRFHIQPDTLFVGLEAYRYLEADSFDNRIVRHYDIGASVGRYVGFPYSSFFRVHLSVGIGMIVTDVEGIPGREYTDYYLALGDPTAELRFGRLSVFARPDIRYALGLGYNLLGRQWIRTPYGLPPITIGARMSL